MRTFVYLVVGALLLTRAHAGQAQAAPTFEFHSNFWINLHHFLYHLAQPPGPPPRTPVVAPVGALSERERAVWDSALAYYRAHVIQHDVLFDSSMQAVKAALAGAEDDTVLPNGVVGAGLTRVLDDAAPVYRRHWWPAHDAMNRLWIAAVEPLVARLGPRIARELSRAYATPWYPGPMRVDVSAHAGTRLVAYTTGTTHGHIVIASTDPCDQGYAALETLYHEASHTIVDDGVGPIGAGIVAAAKAHHVPVPPDLWHALMFATLGDLMQRDLAELGVAYEPESGQCDVYRGPWVLYRDAAALFWRPYLFGTTPRDSALANIVVAVSAGKPAS